MELLYLAGARASTNEKSLGFHAALYQIRIIRPTAAPLWIQVNAQTTILEVKRKIYEDGAIEPARQRLIFQGKTLDDDDMTLEKAVSYEANSCTLALLFTYMAYIDWND